MKQKIRALVTGAGGFIGHHMVTYLKQKGFWVRGVDIKYPEFEQSRADEFLLYDLRDFTLAKKASNSIEETYSFAANMGGVGYIESVRAEVMRDNITIDANMLEASRISDVRMFFYPSSACIYPLSKQQKVLALKLREEDAYPADPDTEYGWEKLFAERMCLAYRADYGLNTKIARFHNVYGPLGIWQGGREKSPAAICRKIAQAKSGDAIEIWGDGKQTRSYCFIDDCLDGVYSLTHSDWQMPVNIGSDESISIDGLVQMVTRISRKKIIIKYDLTKPQGVRGRNADVTCAKQQLKWQPKISLKTGIEKTYRWIEKQMNISEEGIL